MAKNKESFNATYISKKEAEEAGFNYEQYEYEAKMVGVPGQLVTDSVFRVTGDMAVAINESNDGYLIVKIDDPTNPGISFVEIEYPTLIKVASKAKVFGDTFNNIELIEALKNQIFEDDAAVIINSPDGDGGYDVTAIFKCSGCNKLHISCADEESLYGTLTDAKVYLNRVYEKKKSLTRREFLNVLESIPEIIQVALDFDDDLYTLTNVSKCPNCPAIHLDCNYDEHTHSQN
jgi:hypothetical protein